MPLATTYRAIIRNAHIELGVLDPDEALTDAQADWGLSVLARILDDWNAERLKVWAALFLTETMTPSLSPHTIGPTGTWVVAQRPVSIEHMDIILSTGVRTPVTIRNAAWWANQRTPELTSSLPTDLYYQADWPDGKAFIWPIPTIAYDVELQVRVLLDTTVGLTTTFTLPPGYEDALTLTLAEAVAPGFGKQIHPETRRRATLGRARIESNNADIPYLKTQDSGMPERRSPSYTTFNYLNGLFR